MRGAFGHYLPPAGVESLHKYAYVSGHKTPFDIILNYWWEAVEKAVPGSVHPNTLTVCSCVSAILGSCLLLGFCPYMSEYPPRWAFLGAAILFFGYQTLDAIDGKHARRLGLSSPLGQLMDHGCDIICTTPLTLLKETKDDVHARPESAAQCCTQQRASCCGVHPAGLSACASMTCIERHLCFLSTHAREEEAGSSGDTLSAQWWELHFHVFYTATGAIGVTEAQLFVMLLAIIGALFGAEVYHVDLLQYLPATLGSSLQSLAKSGGITFTPSVLFQLLLLTCNIALCACNIFMGMKKAQQDFVAIAQLVMFVVYLFVQGTVYMHCLVWRPVLSPFLVYIVICSTYSILLLRLCLSATCRFPYKVIQWPMLPLAVAAVALRMGDLTVNQEFGILLAVCIFNCMYLADFVYTVISDVCEGLNITCFTVSKPKVASDSQTRRKRAEKAE
ncbi:hypothetical protein Efla_005768 [Eimeria flavescens]